MVPKDQQCINIVFHEIESDSQDTPLSFFTTKEKKSANQNLTHCFLNINCRTNIDFRDVKMRRVRDVS